MSILNEFREHIKYLKKKDKIAIEKVERRFECETRLDRDFSHKTYDIYDAFRLQAPYLMTVLKEYIDNPLGELLFDTPFSPALVWSVLIDRQFTAMLMCNNLLRRAAKLGRRSKGQVKLRVYIAILNFDRYKKEKACKH